MARIHPLALLGALLAGCASGGIPVPASLEARLQDNVTLGVMANIRAGRTVQAVVSPYTPSDVDHLSFTLSRQNADSTWTVLATQATPNGSGTSMVVNFSHLKMNTTYKVQVKCYTAANVDITKADGSGAGTITTTNDNYVALSVGVNLADKTYDGTMHPMVSVASGSVVNSGSAESGSVADNN
jgi:hypothetical protein